MKRISGSLMSVGESGRIVFLDHSERMRRRLCEIGFSPGSKIECVGVSPFGDPCAYLVKGAVFALRKSDASLIYVDIE